MLKRFQKQVVLIVFIVTLVVSQTMSAFAGPNLSPADYVFTLVLRSCGVSPLTMSTVFRGAYEGYLKKSGNQALLNQLRGYDSLSWGSTATDIDILYRSVKEWLSSGSARKVGSAIIYDLPSSPAPQPNRLTAPNTYTILSTPFSDVSALPSEELNDYRYLFSYINYESTRYYCRNVYAPKDIEIFGVVGAYYSYDNGVQIKFYTPDSSSSTGYRLISLKYMQSQFLPSDYSLIYKDLSSISFDNVIADVCSLMNYPFKVFARVSDAEIYCKTGVVKGAFNENMVSISCYGESFGADMELLNRDVSFADNSITIPDSYSTASSVISNLQKPLELENLMSALNNGGLEISYMADYKVEHYKQDLKSEGQTQGWTKESEEILTGTIGQLATFEPKEYPNYIYASELIQPEDTKVLEDGSLVVKVYYQGDPEATYPYTIEYYKENELFQSVSKTVPMFGSAGTTPRVVDSCEDLCPEYYLPDTASSTSLPYLVSETNNVIKIYYQKDRLAVYPYTVEYYKDGEALKTLSGTVPVFDSPIITSYENYCPDYYIIDDTASTPLPYTVSKEDNVVKVYYKKDETAKYPYTIEYYKDEELFESISGEVPVFGDTTVTSYEDFCPEYYLLDSEFTTALPYTVSKEDNVIKVYYKKDVTAKYSYTIDYYKDGQIVKSLPGTVPVFTPLVSSALSFCPSGYIQDTASSTVIPYNITKDGDSIKIYYVKRDTVLPYRVEYYKDGLWMKSSFGNISSLSPSISSVPSYCPEYYTVDASLSTPLPHTVTSTDSIIKIYYQKDEAAKLPYTIEYYKNGALVDTTKGDVSVFTPHVDSYDTSLCPEGYVLDTTSSSTFPYAVSKEDHVIKVCYVQKEDVIPYTVEHYRGDYLMKTESFNVPVSNPVVTVIWSDCPDGYLIDNYSSTPLPHTITKDDNVLRICYLPDMKNPMTALMHTVIDTTAASAGMITKSVAILLIPFLLIFMIEYNLLAFKRMVLGGTEKKRKTKTYTASSSMFMKGVHKNTGASISQKARMTQGNPPGSLKSKASMKARGRYQ